MSETVLITGIAGLMGSRMGDWLLENKPDLTIVGIDDLSGGYANNISSGVIFYEGNILDPILADIFNRHKPTYVYHFAAYAAEGLSPFIRKFNYQNNLVATANINTECKKHKVTRLVFTSSLAVYGHGEGGLFDEEQTPKPIDPYGVAKFACEMDIQIAGEQHGLDWCILRPHNVYGIKQNIWDRYRNVLGIWMYQALNHQPLTIFGDGLQTRAFSYIDDILEPMWNAAVSDKASGQIINLGGIQEHSILESCQQLRAVMGIGEIIHKEARHEVRHSIPTWQKSVSLLGFSHKTSLKDGLSQMWEWAKNQPNRERFVWDEYELDEGIYSFWKKNENIRIYFYIYFKDYKANAVFAEMLNRIETSGLYDRCDQINICFAGKERFIDKRYVSKEKYKLIQVRNSFEFDALNMIWNDCQNDDFHVCYIHAKGITRPDSVKTADWRHYMSHFIIDKWKDRVLDLAQNDCSGVNFQGNHDDYHTDPATWGYINSPVHYSGNFWWSKSSHIRKLKSPKSFWPSADFRKWRIVPEMWVCQIKEANYYCAWTSGVDHYHQRYTQEQYIKQSSKS
ncbi:MAG: NAD-dependent epimerase/dehydratase family protein [Myxococcota bacterium]|nr:NAD-dependent epimerase/dehydratase family protein [Myxococcota bacterium]